jgi:hypothetical protein
MIFLWGSRTGLPRLSVTLDRIHPVWQDSWRDGNKLKAEVAIGLFVHAFETQAFLKADPPCFGRRDEAKIMDEEQYAS